MKPPDSPRAPAPGEWRSERGRTFTLLVLALALGFAAFVRLHGVDFLLPQRQAPDEEVFVHQLQILRGELQVGHEDYRQGIYPRLVPLLANALERTSSVEAASIEPADLAESLARAGADHVLLRTTVAALSLLGVLGTWLLARRLVAPVPAVLAALLCAGSSFFALYAPQARPHAAEAAFAVLALAACVHVALDGGARAYLVGGLALALAIGTLHSGVLLLGALLAAHLLRARERRWRDAWKLGLALVPAALAVPIFYPYLFWSTSSASGASRIFGLVDPATVFGTQGAARMLQGLWDYEPWLLLALVPAAWLAWRRRATLDPASKDGQARIATLVIAAWIVPYCVLFGVYAHTMGRYALPLVPILCILVAWAAWELGARLGPRARFVPALVLFVLQCASAWQVAHLRAQPGTIALAARWIAEQPASTDEPIWTMPALDPPLLRRAEIVAQYQDAAGYPWLGWQARHPRLASAERTFDLRMLPLHPPEKLALLRDDPAAFVHDLGGGLVLLELYDRPFVRELARGVREHGTLLARFSPFGADDPGEAPFLWRDTHDAYERELCWSWSAWRAERLGAVIEIYRVRS